MAAPVLDVSLDAVVTIDHQGLTTAFSAGAERLFGYPRAEAIGRPMSELIIPPALREAHHRGMARYLATGVTRILNRRLEVTAVRGQEDGAGYDDGFGSQGALPRRTRSAHRTGIHVWRGGRG